MKKLLLFLFASISFQPPILASGCIAFLESKGIYNNKSVESFTKAKYAFRGLHPKQKTKWASEWYEYREKNTSNWINCELSGGYFENGFTYCNGKKFFFGIARRNYYMNAFFDKNGNEWNAFRGQGIAGNPYDESISDCYYDPEKSLYWDFTDKEYDLVIPQAEKNVWIKVRTYTYYQKGIKPSF